MGRVREWEGIQKHQHQYSRLSDCKARMRPLGLDSPESDGVEAGYLAIKRD